MSGQLTRIADALDEALDQIRAGNGDPLSSIEILSAQLRDIDENGESSTDEPERDEDKPMTVEVYQLVRYDLTYYSGTPEMVMHEIESGPGWDDSNNEVITDRVVIYRDGKVIHDSNPDAATYANFGPTP